MAKGLLGALFHELTRVFEDSGELTALSVLSTCLVPGVITGMTEDEFGAAIEARH